MPSSIGPPNRAPDGSTPNSSSSAFTPCQPAIARSRWRSLAASILPTVMLARLRTSQIAVAVDFDTPAGCSACTTVLGRDSTVSVRCTPAGDHGISQHRYTITAASTPPTRPG